MKLLKALWGALLALFLVSALVGTAFAQQQAITVPIKPAAGSAVTGTAALTGLSATSTMVTMSLSGFGPNTSHAVHVHLGRCAAPGGIAFDLPTLTADASGMATPSETIDAPLSSLTDGNHLIMIHAFAPPGFGLGVACGDIPTNQVAGLLGAVLEVGEGL